MSNIPSKTLIGLFAQADANPNKTFEKAHFSIYKCATHIELEHYGTLIFRYYYENGYYETGGAYSLTDSRYINGMCRLLKIPAIARVRNYELLIDPCPVEKPTKWM